ncbi:MAG: DNA polymerase III subunit alpha [Coriobacteriia bacterium]|nr:DNA polymerase III subunit alpha [Coriobacteriia bacterium]MBS5477115.1 DNA polymerase III subunit alpha [Coriobacteriia bacterium]
MAFVHLHCHSEYSMCDGITRLKDMAKRAWKLGMPACALTDHGYMYGCAEWYLDAIVAGSPNGRKGPEYGIKPIIGCEVYFTPDNTLSREKKPDLYHLILLAKNNTGYVNLMNIVSKAATAGFYYKPRVTLDSLRSNHEGILATSACISGIIPRCLKVGERDRAAEWAKTFGSIFGPDDFYIELQNHNNFVIDQDTGMTELDMDRELASLAKELGIKTVATNDFHYLRQEDASTQELMVFNGRGWKMNDQPPHTNPYPNDQFYMKTEEEMRAALADYQDACDTTIEIAEKCGARPDGVIDSSTGVEIKFGQILLPKYPGLEPGQTHESQFRRDCEDGLARHYGADYKTARPDVVERFEYEYKVICDKGFAAYFLIVADYVKWAKENGIGVGPGRGSAAGAIVAYAMDITAFDPLANGLMFERFLSPERTEMPDIDMDFDDERRLDVIDYVRQRYGSDQVTHVITYSVLKAKAAIKDAARVQGYPVSLADKLSKMISGSPDKHNTLNAALGNDTGDDAKAFYSPDFVKAYNEDPDSRQVIDSALAIEGLTRGEGVHACAVLIAPEAVNKHVPTKLDTKGGVEITQYEGHTVADMGLLKMDFLGLRTLTVLSKAQANIKMTTGKDIVLEDIPFDDPKIFELMGSGHTAGVFQVESGGMTATIKNMKPREYKHVVALIALYRPGPLGAGMVTSYINRMNGKEPAVSYDPRLDDILGETYGTMVYQEQVMQISVKMCGFSAGESDSRMRKPVAKKKIDMLTSTIFDWSDGAEETIYDHWMNGAKKNGYKAETAQTIWNDVLEFASYAFNKSHSAGYAILVMQTAWLKAHYPNEYMAAVLTSYTGKTEKITHYIAACRYDGIQVLLPDVNQSGNEFTPVEEGVRFGLAGIKGVGEGVSDLIVKEREANGPFQDIFDFVDRIDLSKINRKVIESLIKAGAFDSTDYSRKQLSFLVAKDNPANIIDAAQREQKNRAAGQLSMFDLLDEEDTGSVSTRVPSDHVEWDNHTKLAEERAVLGIYVSDHPLRPFAYALSQERDFGIGDIEEEGDNGGYRVPEKKVFSWAGMVNAVQKKVTGKGDQMAVFTLEDMEGEVACVVFPKVFGKQGGYLYGETDENGISTGDVFVKIRGSLERSDRGNQIIVMEIEPLVLTEANNRPRVMEIRIGSRLLNQSFIAGLSRLFGRYPGSDNVELLVEEESGRTMRAEIPLHIDARNVALYAEVQDALHGQGSVVVA